MPVDPPQPEGGTLKDAGAPTAGSLGEPRPATEGSGLDEPKQEERESGDGTRVLATGETVDTSGDARSSVVSSVLQVPTDGQRTTYPELHRRFFSREPVFDKNQLLVGYELKLRHRRPSGKAVRAPDLERLDDEMLLTGLLDANPAQFLGEKLLFVSLSSRSADSPMISYLPPGATVLAWRSDPKPTAEEASLIREWVNKGYRVALDGYVPDPILDELLAVASYVRINAAQIDALALGEKRAEILKRRLLPLIAFGVNSNEAYEACKRLGYAFFQGYYFMGLQPELPARLDSDRQRVLQLLNLVMAHAEISELEAAFKRDAALSYRLLRYVNSPGGGLTQKLRSIAHALVVLGHDQLYRWLTLLLFSSGKPDPRCEALLHNAMVRARLMEVVGRKRVERSEVEGLFIVGIFSVLDALLNMPMKDAVAQLHLPDNTLAALVDNRGLYSPFLELAKACEQADSERIEEYAAVCNLDADFVNRAHLEAMIWADQMSR